MTKIKNKRQGMADFKKTLFIKQFINKSMTPTRTQPPLPQWDWSCRKTGNTYGKKNLAADEYEREKQVRERKTGLRFHCQIKQ